MGFGGNDAKAPQLNCSSSGSSSDSKRFQEDKFDSLHEESKNHKLDKEHSENPRRQTMVETPSCKDRESLKQEILLLEKQLETQFEVRQALESALGYESSSSNEDTETTIIPESVAELIHDVAVLELEVGQLEQLLLSQYRKVLDRLVLPLSQTAEIRIDGCRSSAVSSLRDSMDAKLSDHLIYSTISDPCSFRWSAPDINSKEHRESSISQPFIPKSAPVHIETGVEHASDVQSYSDSLVSMTGHLGTKIFNHLPETPNRLSEDMIKCISAIYCKLSDGSQSPQGGSSNSFYSSMSRFSWRPGLKIHSPFSLDSKESSDSISVRLFDPNLVEGLKEFSGPYSTMVEVPGICRDDQKLGKVEHLLHHFRSIISRLQEVDPTKLTHEEKMAFWINVHNSLVMHAFLTFGVPHHNMKRAMLLMKAAYNIGGHTINAETILSSILRCRMPRPGQWVRKLIPLRSKFKTEDKYRAYAIHKPEPLLYFALSSGSYSDPVVRVYTPKRIFQELEIAKDDYILATIGSVKNLIILPKLVESFAKDSGLSHKDVLKTLPECLQDSIKMYIANSKFPKVIDWTRHHFSFRYLISKELVMY